MGAAMDERERFAFIRGFGVALADLMRLHTPEIEVCDTIKGSGLTIEAFFEAGLEEYGLAELRKALGQ